MLILSRRTILARLAGLSALASLAGTSRAADAARPLVVASKSDTEGSLTGAMIALALEHLGLPVARKLGLGPTSLVRGNLLSGEIDCYPEYTGNGAFFTGTESDPAWKVPQAAYDTIRHLDAARGLVWLARAPANNTWLIAVNGALARREGWTSMADFARGARAGLVRLAASTEFVESPAALPSFEAAYEFTLPLDRIVSLPGGDTAVTARAAAQGISGVNAGMVYGTDGALSALDLVVMSDPRGAQIVYEVAPVIRADTLARHPEIAPALDRIFTDLDADTLRALNARITVEGEVAEAVARDHLARRGFPGMTFFGAGRLPVLLAILWSAALAGTLTALPLLRVAANRLVVGDAVFGKDALGPAFFALLGTSVLIGALFAVSSGRALGPATQPFREKIPALVAALLLAGALAILAVGLGNGAVRHLAGRPPAARASLGAGAWSAAFLLLPALGLALRRSAVPGLAVALPGLLLAGLIVAGQHGAFDGLSLAVEYAARREAVNAALAEHVVLSIGAVGLGSLGAVALFPWRRGRGLVELAIGGVQVVPAVALFGALVALTSGLLRSLPGLRDLGLSALGPAPALAGIAAYLLLPLWRGLSAALRAPDPATLQAAQALGLTRFQVLARIRLPLGAPLLVGALRVATVQSLGLATLGALIGAGGLGRIVFDGMAQFAPDLILLGALPVVGLSLIAERGLGRVEAWARGRWRP